MYNSRCETSLFPIPELKRYLHEKNIPVRL